MSQPEQRRNEDDEGARGDQRPFDRFKDLARKLVQVPKKEVQEADAKRKKRRR